MQVEKSIENMDKCLCMRCVSYTNHCKMKNAPENFLQLLENYHKADHYEKMYCAYEQSHCIKDMQKCLCNECEVYCKYGLQNVYYCLKTGGQKKSPRAEA
ncbi:MAG: DUF2769 domain-containing protein [Alphaproteobacteria bacterium]|nr:DUF2769 domain-containing protein [Alphaproteobacteria bacterium]